MIENTSQIVELMKKKNINKKRLAELTGYSPGTISDVLNGKTELSERFARIVSNALNDASTIENAVRLIPVYATVPAGWPVDSYVAEEPIGYVPFEGNGRNMGALLVEGHSMSPDIRDGEFVVYVEDYNIKPGDKVVVTNEFGKPMVKEYALKDGEPWLISINPEYGNHKVNENYRIIGRVIEVFNKRKIGRG